MKRDLELIQRELDRHYRDVTEEDRIVTPEAEEIWESWKSNLRSNEVLCAVELPEIRYIRSENAHLIGKLNDDEIGTIELKQQIHPDQVDLVFLINQQCLLLLLQYKKLSVFPKYVFKCTRAVKVKDGTFWLASYRTKSWQLDVNGKMLSYLGRYTLLQPYSGEYLYHTFEYEGVTDEVIIRQLFELNKELKKMISATVAEYYGLTPKRTQIVKLLSSGKSRRQIHQLSGIPTDTIKDNVDYIRKTAKSSVTSRPIRTAADAADYFIGVGLLVDPL